jgi:tetratricopeptide (TPR) repeat protein
MRRTLLLVVLMAACRGDGVPVTIDSPTPPPEPTSYETRLPQAPGPYAPSLLTMSKGGADGPQDGDLLADVDTCSSCHAEVTAQWQSSIHSFASFANPIYRANIEVFRANMGNEASQHCGGCHDMPLEIDGAMMQGIAADDLRAHTGVSCRVCHGASAPTKDGNASFVLNGTPMSTPNVDDAASVAAHKAAVDVKPLGDELCVTCHRGFLSPDLGTPVKVAELGMPVHLSGIDEPTAWRSSAWNGAGAGRVDKVDKQGCISCHMPEVEIAAGAEEYPGADQKVRAHTFAGGHTWMASMRNDAAQLARIQKMLVGAASIDIAGAIVPAAAPANGPATIGGRWHLPADGAPVVPGKALAFDVVIRNLLTGHRFPGGVVDMQDTWIEIEVADARGKRLASSGLDHAKRGDDTDAHVLRSYPVDAQGNLMQQHQLFGFRAVVSNQSIAARDAVAVRYAMDVPTVVALPLQVTARLRHRTRTLENQRVTCEAAKVGDGAAFLRQALALRDMVVDPCKPQPITEIAATTVWLGDGAAARQAPSARPAWERSYEHGMALTQVVSERLEESRAVLEHALTLVPAGDAGKRPRAMILVQLASVAGKQGRADAALALVAEARALLPTPSPPALDAYAADALVRVWRWKEAEPFARAVTERAPANAGGWTVLARVRGSLADDRGALAAAVKGLELAPRDPDLLRSQATALAQLLPGSDLAAQALAAYDRFRAPDDAAQLRMNCAAASKVCARERELGHTHRLVPSR